MSDKCACPDDQCWNAGSVGCYFSRVRRAIDRPVTAEPMTEEVGMDEREAVGHE